jgi:hypothetical protein
MKPIRHRRAIAPINFLVRDATMDPADLPEAALRVMYFEYLAALGRPVPTVTHRQGRSIPGANGPITDSLCSNAGHCLVVYGEVKAGELG